MCINKYEQQASIQATEDGGAADSMTGEWIEDCDLRSTGTDRRESSKWCWELYSRLWANKYQRQQYTLTKFANLPFIMGQIQLCVNTLLITYTRQSCLQIPNILLQYAFTAFMWLGNRRAYSDKNFVPVNNTGILHHVPTEMQPKFNVLKVNFWKKFILETRLYILLKLA